MRRRPAESSPGAGGRIAGASGAGGREDAQAMAIRVGSREAAAEVHIGWTLQDGEAAAAPVRMEAIDIRVPECDLTATSSRPRRRFDGMA